MNNRPQEQHYVSLNEQQQFDVQSEHNNSLLVPSPLEELTLDDVIARAKFPIDLKRSTTQLRNNIVAEFNSGVTTVITQSSWRGHLIKPNEVLMYQCNGIQELAVMSGNYLTPPMITWTNNISKLGEYAVTSLYFGGNGYERHVVNVPAGKYFRAWSGTQPLLLDSGTHVIKDIGFVLDKPKHEDNLVDQAEPFIQHGIISILRVPKGKLAQVWVGTEPKLLESKPQPYVSLDPLFKFLPKSETELFRDVEENCIIFGPLKRVSPTPNQAFISYDNGKLVILTANEKGPIVISSATHIVTPEPINTGVINLILPSEESKQLHRKNNPTAPSQLVDVINTTTKDNLPIGIHIFLTYEIIDLHKAISLMRTKEELVSHIESRTISVMCRIIRDTNYNELFNSSNYNAEQHDDKEKKANNSLNSLKLISMPDDEKQAPDYTVSSSTKDVTALAEPSAPPAYTRVIQETQRELAIQLEEIGVKVDRISLEHCEILNKEIANQMSQQAIDAATMNGKMNRMQQEMAVKQSEAAQQALVSRMQQEQENLNAISAAHTKAEALKITTTAEVGRGNQLAQLYMDHPTLLGLEQMGIQAKALNGATVFYGEIPLGVTQTSSNLFTRSNFAVLEQQQSKNQTLLISDASATNTPGMTNS